MNNVLFSFKYESVPSSNTTLPNKKELFAKLRERDLNPVVSLKGESAFDDTGVEVAELLGESDTRSLGHISLESVGLIVNRLDRRFELKDRIGKKGTTIPSLPDTWQQAGMPFINENEMRSLAYRKEKVYREVLDPLDMGIPTEIVSTPLDVALFAHSNPSEKYILKPNSHSNNTDINSVTADEAIKLISDGGFERDMILQPKYDFTRQFDPSIRPFDSASSEAFDTWNRDGIVKEFRIYAFLSPKLLNMFPVARAFNGSDQSWIFVDPETVPQELYEDTASVARLSAQITGSRALIAAHDIGYGTLGNGELGYKTIELNGRMPHLISYDEHSAVANTLREYFADQIDDTINRV